MKIEILADADAVARQAADIIAADATSSSGCARTLYHGCQWRTYPLGHAP